MQEKLESQLIEQLLDAQVKQYTLVLHNDDVNTFDYVIECLMQVCNHTSVQAEQCATITHYNGKCEIKNGDKSDLNHLREILLEMGLSVTIQKLEK